jgi:DNA-binding MarR family transcriptional regulator
MKRALVNGETYQTVYQRKKYAPIKKEVAKKRKDDFFLRHPNWDKQKNNLTDEEIYILSNYYGLEGPRLYVKTIASSLGVTPQWLHVRIKRIEATLLED